MPLDSFHSVVRAWFEHRYGQPTEIQRLGWPPILEGEHVLVSAPTGSGKTLTGFLGALDQLLTGAWPVGSTRVLYVSPLKALNADIERNLREPLAGLSAAFTAAGHEPEPVRVGVRSGDTPSAERQRMLRRPPEIVITTPESLNLLLLSKSAPAIFAGLRLVILDEIHAVAGNKRGTHLITAVDRLVRIAGEFQRLAISATVRPLDRVARFVGGYRLLRSAGGEARYEPRSVRIVESRAEKRYDLSVRFPLPPLGDAPELREGEELWRALAADLRARIDESRSTLVFTNSRRMSEKITRFVNEAAGGEVAWSHHGSLSREIRSAVEARLKAGQLPAIVATSSLELGIDIGALDRVLLLQTPRTLASAAQRIGRAGHRAGEVSRAILYPTHARDFLDAAVAVRAVLTGEIEPIRIVRAPLDLLAQTLLALVASERWSLDELFDFVRTSDPYRELNRGAFDLVVEMLSGRYADARIEELRPRVRVDRLDGTIAGRPGLTRLLARAGGTIPDRGYFALKLEGEGAKIGELDEEFVWERRVGDVFILGTQAWRIRSIGANEVFVAPARGGALLAPFWRADAQDRGAFYSERVASFLEEADQRLGEDGFERELCDAHGFEPGAASELVRLLGEQKAAQGVALPHRRHVVFELVDEKDGENGRPQTVIYTFWGGRVNRPLALALEALWEEREGVAIETVADDDAVLLVLPSGADTPALLAALDPERIEQLLRRRLEGSGFFGAHFRQNAQRALLLPRASPRRRTPLWVSRQNARKLLAAVADRDDFPLVLETWRTCLQDEFELGALRERLQELRSGEIRVHSVRVSRPSPFAANLVWRRTNEQMYEDDVPEARRRSALRGDLIREVALAAEERPRIDARLAERYRQTAQRLLPGYPPRDAEELLEWVKERFWTTAEEWDELLAAIESDRRGEESAPGAAELATEIEAKLIRIALGGGRRAIAARESISLVRAVPALARHLGGNGGGKGAEPGGEPAALAAVLGPWLRFHAPLPVERVAAVFDLPRPEVSAAIDELVRDERAVRGALLAGSPADADEVASMSAFETLLRWRRAAARPVFEPLPLERLPLLVAWQQGLVERSDGVEGLQRALERTFGFPAAAAAWEREILPARLSPYLPAWLDGLFEESGLRWLGVGRERVTMGFPPDFDLFADRDDRDVDAHGALEVEERAVVEELTKAPRGLELAELAERLDLPRSSLSRALWGLAWQGRAANESMRVLRQGALGGFRRSAEPPESRPAGRRPSRRSAFRRWAAGVVLTGRWYAIRRASSAASDALDEEERNRERVRLLVDRWGVLFRELLAYELPPLSWSRLARTMRALELGGELVSGHFVGGVPGLQFTSPRMAAKLSVGLPEGDLWWHSASDPASLCGIDLPGLKRELPRRVAGSWLVWRGDRLLATIRRQGREIDPRIAPGDPDAGSIFAPLRAALTRSVDPVRSVAVETIAGAPAESSPFRAALEGFAVTGETRGIRLRRSYHG